MAAATISARSTEVGSPFLIRRIEMNTLTSDQAEDIAHGGPTTVAPMWVLPIVTTSATSGDAVHAEWIKASDSTANNTVRVKFKVDPGGDIAGAKATVFVVFAAQAQGGLSAS